MIPTDIEIQVAILLAFITFWLPSLAYLCCKLGRYGYLKAEQQFVQHHHSEMEIDNGDEEQEEA